MFGGANIHGGLHVAQRFDDRLRADTALQALDRHGRQVPFQADMVRVLREQGALPNVVEIAGEDHEALIPRFAQHHRQQRLLVHGRIRLR